MKFNNNRRDFLKTVGRWSILGALAAFGIDNISTKKPNNDICTKDGVCSRCGIAGSCGHPNALSYRKNS